MSPMDPALPPDEANAPDEAIADVAGTAPSTAFRLRRIRPAQWLLLAALLIGFWLRFSGLNWDGDEHLHPDERFLTMVASSLQTPQDLLGYLDTDTSTLNPRNTGHGFYVYGTWPVTITFFVAQALGAADYSAVHLVGRNLNMLYDWLGLILIFLIGRRLVDERVGALAAFLAAGTAFFIQQAHFFTVDVPANFFFLLFLYGFVRALDGLHPAARTATVNPSAAEDGLKDGYLAVGLSGVALGMALASKIALWPAVPLVMVVLAWRAWRANGAWIDGRRVLLPLLILGISSFVVLRFCQPDMFAGPGWPNVVANPPRYTEVTAKAPSWWFSIERLMPGALAPHLLPDPRWAGNLSEVSRLVQGYGVDWPPNHQWFGRRDWLFPLQNIVLWGMGLPLGVAAVLSWIWAAVALLRGRRPELLPPTLWSALILGYYGMQFGKTMRYFLPIYPTLILLTAAALIALWDRRGTVAEDGDPVLPDTDRPDTASPQPATRRPAARLAPALTVLVAGGALLWGFMFSRIYAQDHSRILASRWIYHHIPTAFGLTIDQQADRSGRGLYLPARVPSDLRFATQTYRYEARPGSWLGPMEVLVPGDTAVTVDGAQLAHVVSARGGPAQVRLTAYLTESDQLGADGQPQNPLANGTAAASLSDIGQRITVPFDQALILEPRPQQPTAPKGLARAFLGQAAPAAEAAPSKSYRLWVRVEGDALAGRTSIFAHDTSWDDTVPRGIEGYAAWDQAESDWAEGSYGFIQLQMYDEDKDQVKLDRLMQGLQDADYLISTSNRVYGSTRQLPARYPMTNRFYDDLFAERFGIEHTASIHSFPRLGSLEVDDQGAEEAFHVYDHPQVDIWATKDIDRAALLGDLAPLPARYTWQWPTGTRSFRERYLPFLPGGDGVEGGSLLARLLGTGADAGNGVDAGAPGAAMSPEEEAAEARERLLLSPQRRAQEAAEADYVFSVDSVYERWPLLAVLAWYALLAFIGLAAWPLVAASLPNLPDKGWAVARIAGLLLVSWLAWLVASLGWAPHKPVLLWAMLALVGALAWLLPGRRRAAARLSWLAEHRREVLAAEALFAVFFLIFLGIRMGNPDLWHPWYGGEKPMDFAYLNATLRSVSFPPFDPWFSGGKLNYYYFGFVFVGALFELTRVPPWIGYNLAIPSLAAMTALGCAGVVYGWARAQGFSLGRARRAGGLAGLMTVLMGNLYQVPFILGKGVEFAGPLSVGGGAADFSSRIPGLALAVNGLRGVLQAALSPSQYLNVATGHWYWNASRAIPDQGETVAITEMPFFTFVYADLHAHMMALPITVLVLACALSWALPTRAEEEGWWWLEPWGLGRLLLASLAIGALWPANTWDVPTYGLVAAGALGAGLWQRMGGPSWRWLWAVLWRGLLLLGLSRLLFQPYHANYVTAYADFSFWTGTKTPLSAYLTVHGIFLVAISGWGLWQLNDALGSRVERRAVLATLTLSLGLSAAAFWWLWQKTVTGDGNQAQFPPSPWTAVAGTLLIALGITLLLRPRQSASSRFAAWILLLGAFLSQFVEYGVLAGDIARMNTVFKFYIQIWVLWAVLAACAYAWLAERIDAYRVAPLLPRLWRLGFQALVCAGLVYTVTAAKGKIADRFPVPAAAAASPRPGLSGLAYMDWALYEDGGNILPEQSRLLVLKHDRHAMLWLLANVKGSPVLLEAFHYMGGYHWGSRYSVYTGLPTVIGWDWHQTQQRNAGGRGVIEQRMQDVQAIYNSASLAEVQPLLEQYDVAYIVVGELERALFQPAGIAKFDGLIRSGGAELVYESPPEMRDERTGEPAVKIYRLLRGGEARLRQPREGSGS